MKSNRNLLTEIKEARREAENARREVVLARKEASEARREALLAGNLVERLENRGFATQIREHDKPEESGMRRIFVRKERPIRRAVRSANSKKSVRIKNQARRNVRRTARIYARTNIAGSRRIRRRSRHARYSEGSGFVERMLFSRRN